MLKRLCCLLLALPMLCSVALADATVTIAPYLASDAEISYASLLGLDEPQAVFTFSTTDRLASLRVNVYTLQEDQWLLANTQNIPFSETSGRLALACEHLEESFRIAVQSENHDAEMICHPLFGLAQGGLANLQITLSETSSATLDAEIPLVIRSSSDEGLTLSAWTGPAQLREPSYAITLTFSTEEESP